MCLSGQVLAATSPDVYICPNGKTLMASEVRTPEDVRAFARCARDFIAAQKNHSLNDFRAAFDQPQWLDPNGQGSYVFVNQDKNDGRQAIAQIHPYSESDEGSPIGPVITSFGDYIRNAHWIINRWKLTSAEGYVYYEWDNPATGSTQAPKFSYELRHHDRTADTADGFPGQPASDNYLLGAGVYVPELDGPCKASDLNTSPTPEKLQDFVRCAALKYKNYTGAVNASDIINSRFFVQQQSFSTDLRAGGVYVFVVDAQNGRVDWSAEHPRASAKGTQVDATPEWQGRTAGSSSTAGASGIMGAEGAGSATGAGAESQAVSIGIPNRKVAPVLRDFGEGFLYYNHQNPASKQIERKVTYAKIIRDPNGKQVVLASGYYLQADQDVYPDYNCANPSRRVQADSLETYDDVRAFVMQARCYVQQNGINQARREFQKPEWFHNNTYVFVSENKATGPQSTLEIYPRENSRVGTGFDDFNDRHGNPYYPEVHRIANLMGQGWMYYNFSAPGVSVVANPPKASYIASFEHNGRTYRIGTGLYPDVPGVCANITANTLKQYQDAAMAELMHEARFLAGVQNGKAVYTGNKARWVNGELVTRVDLASNEVRDRATRYLQAFVRCAAQEFEGQGSVEEAKKALVTGAQPAAAEENDDAKALEARAATGKWRSTFQHTPKPRLIGGECSNSQYETYEACKHTPAQWTEEGCYNLHLGTSIALSQGECEARTEWRSSGCAGRPQSRTQAECTTAHTWTPAACSKPGHSTQADCEALDAWTAGSCSKAGHSTQTACETADTWTPAGCSDSGQSTQLTCEAPLGVWMATDTCYKIDGSATRATCIGRGDTWTRSGCFDFRGVNIPNCIANGGSSTHGSGCSNLDVDTTQAQCEAQAVWTATASCSNSQILTQTACETAGTWTAASCSDAQYTTQSECTASRTWTGDSCSDSRYTTQAACTTAGTWRAGLCSAHDTILTTESACLAPKEWRTAGCSTHLYSTQADCRAQAEGNGNEWHDIYSEPKPLTLDGQFRQAPVYTFLYDTKGKLLWGRTRRPRQPQGSSYKLNELEWGTELYDARGGRDTRVGPRANQNVLKRLDTFNEAFVYYTTQDYHSVLKDGSLEPPKRINNVQRNKRAFVKKVRLGGRTYYLGAGVYE